MKCPEICEEKIVEYCIKQDIGIQQDISFLSFVDVIMSLRTVAAHVAPESLSLSQSLLTVSNAMSQLCSALELCAKSIAHYGTDVVAKIRQLASSDYVDRVVIAIQHLRSHVAELGRKLVHHKHFRGAIQLGEMEFVSFVDYLYHKLDHLTYALHGDSYLRRTFQWLIHELKDMIKDVLHNMSLHHLKGEYEFPRFVNTLAVSW